MTKNILNEFEKLNDEIIKNRRNIHEFAKLGFELNKTTRENVALVGKIYGGIAVKLQMNVL